MAEESKKSVISIGGLSQTRIIASLLVLAIVGGALAAVFLRTGSSQKALLYSGLELTEASEIAGRLDQSNIKYEMRGDGSSIFVDRDNVMDARLLLSAEGLPTRGSIGYEVFDKQDALGATTFIQNVNRLRALEGELARTITSLDNVKTARVHLVLPERRLFERDERKPTASIVVEVVGRTLEGGQIRAIRNLAAGAVPGLEPGQVTILDGQGRLLAAAASEENGMAGGMTGDERRAMLEEELRQKILSQLSPVVGQGAARVQVSADIDFNRVTRSSELYDPESRVVRSTETIEESSSDTVRGGQNPVTVEENLPDNGDVAGMTEVEDSQNSRLQEIVNYEISKTMQTEIIEGGTIKRLSVAVAIDHAEQMAAGEEGEAGQVSMAPRSQAEMDQIAALVRSAVGFNEQRGDVLEVVNIRFARPDTALGTVATSSLFGLTKNDIMRSVEIIALLLGGLALIFFVLRPLVAGLLSPPKPKQQSGDNALPNMGDGASFGALPGPGDAAGKAASDLEHTIDVANVTGQVKASSMKKIADMIEKHPDESVSILRSWLNESERGAA
ncbi:flagellar basal-body MS-ring/collar protein FliF [Ponticaulis profundi]|uniref:flagellar basal-body MS-ring/collar protein FliF n=1 Tax=Ponticaulis profundi TaxID=2665222 RepID=UPI00366AC9B0